MTELQTYLKQDIGSGKDTLSLIHPNCDGVIQKSHWEIGDIKDVTGCEGKYYIRRIKWDGVRLEEVFD